MISMLKEKAREVKNLISGNPKARKALNIARKVVVFTIVGIIIYNLFEIGWMEVLQSLPTAPLFYILFLFIFVTLPVAEIFIYRQVWPLRRRDIFKAMITKRVYNEEVMGYSGEFYLFVWGRKLLNKGDVEVLKNIRDNNILSSVTSNSVAILLILSLLAFGVIDVGMFSGEVNIYYVIFFVVLLALLIFLFVQFRKYLFALTLKKALVVFSIYLGRFIIHHSLLIAQWSVAIPDTPLKIWLIFIAIVIAVNRIPFLPSRDLIFLWAGIELSRVLSMTTAAVAGMLLVSSALKKSTNLILFLLISYYSKSPEMEKITSVGDLSKAEVRELLNEDEVEGK